MSFNYRHTKSDLSVSIPTIAGNNSPLTPLLPMERSSFDFSPSAIARCLNHSSVTPKCMKSILSASLKNRRFCSPFLSAQDKGFGSISPGISENDNISYYKVPANSPASAGMMSAEAVDETSSMPCGTSNNLGASAMQVRIPQIRVQHTLSSRISLARGLCIETILKEMCMDHLVEIFTKEEIDLPLFLTMTESELKMIGISDADIPTLLSAIEENS